MWSDSLETKGITRRHSVLQQTSPGSYTFTIIWSNRGLLCMILSSKNSRAKGSIHCSSPLIMHQTGNIGIDLCNRAGPWRQRTKAHCLTAHTLSHCSTPYMLHTWFIGGLNRYWVSAASTRARCCSGSRKPVISTSPSGGAAPIWLDAGTLAGTLRGRFEGRLSAGSESESESWPNICCISWA